MFLTHAKDKLCGARVQATIFFGYKYNMRKVIYFISKEDVGSTKSGIYYYLSTLKRFIMLSFALFIVPFLCLSSLYQ